LGSVIGIGLMLVQRKDFKFAIPFGPFLAFAAIVFVFYGGPLQALIFPEMP
jgi:leader peptidase (prepilin peptidase)/N-methyltransferase